MNILVTGGAGYIRNYTLITLNNAGYKTVVLDNFSNSSLESLIFVEFILGKKIKNYVCDISKLS